MSHKNVATYRSPTSCGPPGVLFNISQGKAGFHIDPATGKVLKGILWTEPFTYNWKMKLTDVGSIVLGLWYPWIMAGMDILPDPGWAIQLALGAKTMGLLVR